MASGIGGGRCLLRAPNLLTGHTLARQLGIDSAWGIPTGLQALGYASDTVMPTGVITAPGGRILWADETDNYRVRPEPGTYLEVLRREGLVAA